MKKKAVLSMDVEDWYHLDYFDKNICDKNQSALDGLRRYIEILNIYNIKSTFFVVGELVEKLKEPIKLLIEEGHEVCLHSYAHTRPLKLNLEEFRHDTQKGMDVFKSNLNLDVKGYRAPCFSLDRARLDILKELGFEYDSSKIKFDSHDLYGNIDLKGFEEGQKYIYSKDGFYEFEVATVEFRKKTIPISGGGYLRIFPWFLTKFLLKIFFKTNSPYFFYIHPFELSRNYNIKVPEDTSLSTRFRFNLGRKSVEKKIHRLIKLLQENNYEFVTFKQIVKNE